MRKLRAVWPVAMAKLPVLFAALWLPLKLGRSGKYASRPAGPTAAWFT